LPLEELQQQLEDISSALPSKDEIKLLVESAAKG
jgi:hypothetical protein